MIGDKMKKNYTIIILIIMMITSIPLINATEQNSKTSFSIPSINITTSEQTIFAEYAATSWCPNCPTASSALYDIIQNSDLPFQYVSLVSDLNPIARNRSWLGYYNVAIPSVYFDGGFQNLVGSASTVPSTITAYEDLINDCINRDTRRNIIIETEANWEGNAEIDFTITVTNNDQSFYIGILRSYVTEINSRWNDYSGESFHYAVLDMPIRSIVFLAPQQSKTFTEQWDGKVDYSGLTFEDITQDNIMIQSAIYHWKPSLHTGYESSDYTQRYMGFYVDQSDSAIPT